METIKNLFEECNEMDPARAYEHLTDAERAAVITGAIYSAARRAAAKSTAPERFSKLLSENMDDLQQDTELRLLENIRAKKFTGRDGEKLDFERLTRRAAAAAVMHAWRDIYSHPTAAETGREYDIIGLFADVTFKRPADPAGAVLKKETITEIYAAIPEKRRPAAVVVVELLSAGYKLDEIAGRLSVSTRTTNRLINTIKDATAEVAKDNTRAAASAEAIAALKALLDI